MPLIAVPQIGPSVVVVVQPGIEIDLQRFDAGVERFAKGHREEFFLDRLEALTGVKLRVNKRGCPKKTEEEKGEDRQLSPFFPACWGRTCNLKDFQHEQRGYVLMASLVHPGG